MISFFVAQTRQAASCLHEMLFDGCKNMSTLVRMFGVLYQASGSELDTISPSQKEKLPFCLQKMEVSLFRDTNPMSMQRSARNANRGRIAGVRSTKQFAGLIYM